MKTVTQTIPYRQALIKATPHEDEAVEKITKKW